MSAAAGPTESLRARKRRETRERIVGAAFALFGERGFDDVTVEEIAERAEVGRTTFFRYFSDKQEVVFARESELIGVLEGLDEAGEEIPDLAGALAESRRLLHALCAEAAARRDHHAAYFALVERFPELGDRHARKLRRYVEALENHLAAHGTPRPAAMLAAQVALGCYQVAWRLAGHDAETLAHEADLAFDSLLRAAEG